ncbi:PspC domain-containing protein [Pseudolysinimonas sp.]|uniref:PspC domain-containing protein n=1 Tax=Pseudolysinimonas sp. TaxID=2680009 RepID=UPI003F823B79
MNGTTLARPREGRIIAGVCAGFARRFGWNVTAVRLLAVLSFVLPGSQLLVYLICWAVIPSDPVTVRSTPPAAPQESTRPAA